MNAKLDDILKFRAQMGLDDHLTPAGNSVAVNGASVFEQPFGGNVVKHPQADTAGTGFKAKLKAELDALRRKVGDDGGLEISPRGRRLI
jgi:hypothetical protein